MGDEKAAARPDPSGLPKATITVQSFGGGVQSVALLRMALDGRFPRPDRVVFADTQQEPEHVYAVVERERAVCEREGIPFDTVSAGDLGAWRENGSIHVPLFTAPGEGQLFRTCTQRFKVEPIQRHLRALGFGKKRRVELWLGMTVDEIQRVKASRVPWIVNRWPLVEANLRRGDCEAYLARVGIDAAKSACVFCPYRSAASWRALSDADFAKAVAYDESIRLSRPGLKAYVNRNRVPLSERPFAIDGPGLFDEECDGVCAA